MSIADKLTAVAENEQKVYDAGKEYGYNDGFDKGFASGEEIGHDRGYQAYYDFFWDGMQNNGNAANYISRFRRWTATALYNPKYNFKHSLSASTSAQETFREAFFTDLKVDNIFSDVSVLAYTCYQCASLVNARTFHVTEKTSYTSPFYGCTNLEEVRFNGTIGKNGLSFSSCTKLSKESHISIVEHLSANASGITVTFSKAAVNKAFETSDGAADGSSSSEWTTLIASKSNWTIVLG